MLLASLVAVGIDVISPVRGIDLLLKKCYSNITYSKKCYFYITTAYAISLISVARQMNRAQVARRLNVGESRL